MGSLGEISANPSSAAAYIILLIASSIVARNAEKNNSKLQVAFLIVILGLFSGLRAPEVGIDTLNFYQKFYSVQIYGVEPGYVWLMRVFASFGSFTLFLLVTDLVTYGLIVARFWELRHKASFAVSIAAFMTVYYFLSLNIIRQFLVIAIVFWASRFLFKKQYLIYLSIVLACTLLHRSAAIALIMLAIIPFRLKEEIGNRRTFLLCVSLLLPILVAAAIAYISTSPDYDAYQRYFDGTYESSGGSGIMTTAKLLLLAVACVQIAANKQLDGFGALIAGLTATGLFGNYLDLIFPYTNRILLYFAIFEPVFWGWCSRNLPSSSKMVIMLFLAALLLYAFYSSMAFDGQGVMPYTISNISLLNQ